ncbi:TOBE domain-containing protein, partial [uncultured Oscillibacter sp.]|uniref:TOBE domain-containing protein n=1 Tax=uncultured Oscillibacter sp. TaxID=876091 RepID=UPI002601C199
QKALAAKNVGSQAITLGVRPSHITLGDGPNTLTATVDVSEMMGSEVHLHANAEGRDVVVIVPTLDLSSVSFAPGTAIHLSFDGSVCHIFDSAGKNLEF